MRFSAVVVAALLGSAVAGCASMNTVALAERARDACREEAADEDFERVEFDERQFGERRIVYSVRLRDEDGDDYEGLCIYDTVDGDVRLDVGRAAAFGRTGAGARERCLEEAEARGYEVRAVRDVERDGDRVRIRMRLERDGRDRNAVCTYRDGDVDLDVEGAFLF